MASAARFAFLLSLAGSVRPESEVETDSMCALQAGHVKAHDGLSPTFTLLESDHDSNIYNPAQNPEAFAAGAEIVWANSNSDTKGSLAGLDQGAIFYSTAVLSAGQLTFILEDGTLTVFGTYDDGAQASTLAVTGGTGRFKGAAGSMLSGTINEAAGKYFYSYTFALSLHAPPCVPLPAHSFSLSPATGLVRGFADKGLRGESPGDIHTMAGPALDAAGARAADVHAFCVTVAGKQQDCAVSVALASGDLLVAQGAWYDSQANESHIVLTGGTGAKQGATGKIEMRKRSDNGFDFAVGGFALPPALPAEHRATEHLALFEPFNDVDTPAAPGQSALPGDLQTWSSTVADQKTKAVLGRDGGYCVRTNATTFQCLYAFILKGGLLTAQGISFEDRPGGPLAVTGGTGKYAGAAGSGTASTVVEGQQLLGFQYTLDVILRKKGL